jgi:hypothetical protein
MRRILTTFGLLAAILVVSCSKVQSTADTQLQLMQRAEAAEGERNRLTSAELEKIKIENQQLIRQVNELTARMKLKEADPKAEPFINFVNLTLITGDRNNPDTIGGYLVGMIYGQTGDTLAFTEPEDGTGGVELWVIRNGEKIRHLAADGPLDNGELRPVELYQLFDQNGEFIVGVPF